jgi:hypothetical protein
LKLRLPQSLEIRRDIETWRAAEKYRRIGEGFFPDENPTFGIVREVDRNHRGAFRPFLFPHFRYLNAMRAQLEHSHVAAKLDILGKNREGETV